MQVLRHGEYDILARCFGSALSSIGVATEVHTGGRLIEAGLGGSKARGCGSGYGWSAATRMNGVPPPSNMNYAIITE